MATQAEDLRFPREFIFGSATSSYQIEGAWNEGGKGESIWDRLVHTNPNFISDKGNGDIACDSYHKYKEDVQLLKQLGFEMYRFSISWPRVLPNGEVHHINEEGLQYYNNLINELLANGIQPMVTMYHWDLPQKLQDLGGWTNPLIVDYFVDYARLLFERFGDRVAWWVTINEPSQIILGYNSHGIYAPNTPLEGVGEYLAGHHMILAHAKAYRVYEKDFKGKQKGKISLSLAGRCTFPFTNTKEDTEAALRYREFEVGWFANPVFGSDGDYPKVMKQVILKKCLKEGRKKSRLPEFSKEEIKMIKGSADYFAFQFYSTRLVSHMDSNDGEPSWMNDSLCDSKLGEGWTPTSLDWLWIAPNGLREMLKWIKESYGNPSVFITENGVPDVDPDPVDDKFRVNAYRTYLQEVTAAMTQDGCNVIGYLAWSLLDNFEWSNGYTAKFGLYHVNFEDPARTRSPKLSTQFFKRLLEKKNSKD